MILWDDETVIQFHMVLASVLEWLEGPKCLSQRLALGLAAGPELSLG